MRHYLRKLITKNKIKTGRKVPTVKSICCDSDLIYDSTGGVFIQEGVYCKFCKNFYSI